jgi:hypothetical protein
VPCDLLERSRNLDLDQTTFFPLGVSLRLAPHDFLRLGESLLVALIVGRNCVETGEGESGCSEGE